MRSIFCAEFWQPHKSLLNKPRRLSFVKQTLWLIEPIAIWIGFMAKEHSSDSNTEPGWQESVWKVVSDIPFGHVLTYGEVAKLAGMPKMARRVSQAMRKAPDSLDLPWHRVINAQGKISFPEDSSGWKQQKNRLEIEGVVFLKGQIDLSVYGYRGAVDRLLWGEEG